MQGIASRPLRTPAARFLIASVRSPFDQAHRQPVRMNTKWISSYPELPQTEPIRVTSRYIPDDYRTANGAHSRPTVRRAAVRLTYSLAITRRHSFKLLSVLHTKNEVKRQEPIHPMAQPFATYRWPRCHRMPLTHRSSHRSHRRTAAPIALALSVSNPIGERRPISAYSGPNRPPREISSQRPRKKPSAIGKSGSRQIEQKRSDGLAVVGPPTGNRRSRRAFTDVPLLSWIAERSILAQRSVRRATVGIKCKKYRPTHKIRREHAAQIFHPPPPHRAGRPAPSQFSRP